MRVKENVIEKMHDSKSRYRSPTRRVLRCIGLGVSAVNM